MVSYQDSLQEPGFRWMKYREAFSTKLVEYLIEKASPRNVLDPFSGIGTAPIVASRRGIDATGIEIMPVSMLAARAISSASQEMSSQLFSDTAARILSHLHSGHSPPSDSYFPHVTITSGAFTERNEVYIARAREFISRVENGTVRDFLNVACMSVLESASFTRKDGQYLRWDSRSGKSHGRMLKPIIRCFAEALKVRLYEIIEDLEVLPKYSANSIPKFVSGSSLDCLQRIPSESFDMVITSPPYANRYDYTRTYALELAWLGYDEMGFKTLRQDMLSATVENKSKRSELIESYGNRSILRSALAVFDNQAVLHEILARLRLDISRLSNRNIVRMLEGYFLEMALIVAELARIVRPAGTVVMVNDNVQYQGEELPVDLVLSSFAEDSGFTCKHIWTLARGKGNSSQQMKRYGRRELRKCVYWWERSDDALAGSLSGL